MLPLRDGGYHCIRAKVANFGPYTVLKFATLAHTPDGADPSATELTPSMPI